jgi:predicted SnoaL-like aldol condensation-catalyzing enzyme
MNTEKKQLVVELLKSLETGDSQPLSYVNPNKYIQHNPAVADGLSGLKAFVQILPKGSTKANPVRVFQDGDYVFAHVAYNVFGPKTGFDIFRFEDGKIVEHWDNLQQTPEQPNPSGHTMIDGETSVADLDKTAANKALVRAFVDDILVKGRVEKFATYFEGDNYVQHNPYIADQASGLGRALQELPPKGMTLKYERIQGLFGEGNFVLVIGEGAFAGKPTSFYDLFRVQRGKIAEHWDVLETITPRAEWKNNNGKFGF